MNFINTKRFVISSRSRRCGGSWKQDSLHLVLNSMLLVSLSLGTSTHIVEGKPSSSFLSSSGIHNSQKEVVLPVEEFPAASATGGQHRQTRAVKFDDDDDDEMSKQGPAGPGQLNTGNGGDIESSGIIPEEQEGEGRSSRQNQPPGPNFVWTQNLAHYPSGSSMKWLNPQLANSLLAPRPDAKRADSNFIRFGRGYHDFPLYPYPYQAERGGDAASGERSGRSGRGGSGSNIFNYNYSNNKKSNFIRLGRENGRQNNFIRLGRGSEEPGLPAMLLRRDQDNGLGDNMPESPLAASSQSIGFLPSPIGDSAAAAFRHYQKLFGRLPKDYNFKWDNSNGNGDVGDMYKFEEV